MYVAQELENGVTHDFIRLVEAAARKHPNGLAGHGSAERHMTLYMVAGSMLLGAQTLSMPLTIKEI